MTGLLLRNRKGSRIEIIKFLVLIPCRNMCVTAQKNISFFEGRGILLGMMVPMSCKDAKSVYRKPSIVRKNGEGENHLVNLSLAISSDAKQIFGNSVQHLYHLLGRVVPREIVSRAMIKKIAKKKDLIGGFFLNDADQFFAVI